MARQSQEWMSRTIHGSPLPSDLCYQEQTRTFWWSAWFWLSPLLFRAGIHPSCRWSFGKSNLPPSDMRSEFAVILWRFVHEGSRYIKRRPCRYLDRLRSMSRSSTGLICPTQAYHRFGRCCYPSSGVWGHRTYLGYERWMDWLYWEVCYRTQFLFFIGRQQHPFAN